MQSAVIMIYCIFVLNVVTVKFILSMREIIIHIICTSTTIPIRNNNISRTYLQYITYNVVIVIRISIKVNVQFTVKHLLL